MASFDKLPSGVNRARIYLYLDGKRTEKYHTILHEDMRQLRRLASEFETQELERSRAGVSDKLLFSIAAQEWLAEKKADLGPCTYLGYSRTVSAVLTPKWGKRRVGSISERDVAQWIAEMRSELSDTSARQYCIPFFGIMKRVLKGRSPCRDLKLPAQVKYEAEPPSVEDQDRLQFVVQGTRDEINFRLIADCGLRRGEIHGLTYRQALRTAGRLYITQAATASESGWVLDDPKSRRSRRSVAVPEELQELIWQRMVDTMRPKPLTVRQQKDREKLAKQGIEAPPRPEFVAPTCLEEVPEAILDSLVEPMSPHGYSSRFRAIIDAHNAHFNKDGSPRDREHDRESSETLTPRTFRAEGTLFRLLDAPLAVHRFYDLRHFHASQLMSSGVSDAYSAARLGHDPNILRSTYQHLLPEYASAMDARVMDMLARKPAPEVKKPRKSTARPI